MSVKELKKGDVVKVFGSKIKIYIKEDQNTDKRMMGFSDVGKTYQFTKDKISQITRDGKIFYKTMEE